SGGAVGRHRTLIGTGSRVTRVPRRRKSPRFPHYPGSRGDQVPNNPQWVGVPAHPHSRGFPMRPSLSSRLAMFVAGLGLSATIAVAAPPDEKPAKPTPPPKSAKLDPPPKSADPLPKIDPKPVLPPAKIDPKPVLPPAKIEPKLPPLPSNI